MANRFWNFVLRFTAGTLAKAGDVNTNLDGIYTGFDDVQDELDQSIQITAAPGTTHIALNAAARALKIMSFDSSGNVVAVDDIGDWQGDHVGGTDYLARDLVKDANGDIGLNNIYRANTAFNSNVDMAVDAANWDLVVDVTDSVAAALLSQQWASLETGIVDATDYSSKAYAVGGTGVTGAAGASKEWAITAEDSPVDGGTGFSALHHAAKAATSAAGALASLEEFDGKYYGPRTTAQETNLDPNGDASTDGDIYFNITLNRMKVFNGATWQLTTANAADVALSDSGNYFSIDNAEAALQQLGAILGTDRVLTVDLPYNTTAAILDAGWFTVRVSSASATFQVDNDSGNDVRFISSKDNAAFVKSTVATGNTYNAVSISADVLLELWMIDLVTGKTAKIDAYTITTINGAAKIAYQI